MSGHLRKRSVSLQGHRTSVALEPAFLDILDEVAAENDESFAALVARVDAERDPTMPLASVLRVMALEWAKGPRNGRL